MCSGCLLGSAQDLYLFKEGKQADLGRKKSSCHTAASTGSSGDGMTHQSYPSVPNGPYFLSLPQSLSTVPKEGRGLGEVTAAEAVFEGTDG